MIIYTSGTTGNPKGVVHTHGSLEAMMSSMEEAWQWSKSDHIANVLPLHHVHGIMNVMNTALWSGAQCTLIPKFDNKKMWNHLLDTHADKHFTVFMAVPTIYKKMIDYYEAEGMSEQSKEIKIKLKEFRLMVSGSAPLPPSQFEKWKEITGHTLLERFGMTEVGMALTNPYEPAKMRLPGQVGIEFPGVKAQLMDDSSNLHRNPEDPGELVL
jgi:malonyl-CoA/methylmalonyl-CoA synthetase